MFPKDTNWGPIWHHNCVQCQGTKLVLTQNCWKTSKVVNKRIIKRTIHKPLNRLNKCNQCQCEQPKRGEQNRENLISMTELSYKHKGKRGHRFFEDEIYSGVHCKMATHKAACSNIKFYLAELTFNFPTSQSCMSPFSAMVLCIECT